MQQRLSKKRFNDFLANFSGVSESEVNSLLALGSEKIVRRGDDLVPVGSLNYRCAFIIKGGFYCFFNNEMGKDIVKGIYFENQMFGPYAEYLLRIPVTNYYRALEDSLVLIFSMSEIFSEVDQSHSLSMAARQFAEGMFLAKDQRETQLLNLNAESRYREFMVNCPPQNLKKLSKSIMASYLGMRPETLSRIIKKYPLPPY